MSIIIGANNVSYLYARDPSIRSVNRPQLMNIRTNLQKDRLNEESVMEELYYGHMRIYLRLKNDDIPSDLYDIQDDTIICKIPDECHTTRQLKYGGQIIKKYTFSKIFDPNTSQMCLFNEIVKPKMLNFINGVNCTVLAYGSSGSGKTFTLIGTADEPGLIPRALEYLFSTLPQSNDNFHKPLPNGDILKLDNDTVMNEMVIKSTFLNNSSKSDKNKHKKTYNAMQSRLSCETAAILDETDNISIGIWVSFAEIYNENIYDLLQFVPQRGQKRTKLSLSQTNDGKIFIKNLNSINITNGLEAYQILQYGLNNLSYASTKINDHSSRSHAIFTIKLVQFSNLENKFYLNYFNFCDLAGSERMKKTDNTGLRRAESNNINTSLLVLGRCIQGVRDLQTGQKDQKTIPFRESKLTRLFKRALCGDEDISMIVNITTLKEMFDETQHTLNFSAIAKDIVVNSKPNKPKLSKRLSDYYENKYIKQNYNNNNNQNDNVECLKNRIAELELLYEEQKLQTEDIEKEILERLSTEYGQLIESIKTNWERRYKDIIERMTNNYERKIEQLQNSSHHKKINETIVLDESFDKNHDENLNLSKNDIKLQLEIATLNAKNRKIDNENEELQKKISEYKELLVEAKENIDIQAQSYNETINKIMLDNICLNEKLFEYKTELDSYKFNCKCKSIENLNIF